MKSNTIITLGLPILYLISSWTLCCDLVVFQHTTKNAYFLRRLPQPSLSQASRDYTIWNY